MRKFKSNNIGKEFGIEMISWKRGVHTLEGAAEWVESFIFGNAMQFEGDAEKVTEKWNGKTVSIPEMKPNTTICRFILTIF